VSYPREGAGLQQGGRLRVKVRKVGAGRKRNKGMESKLGAQGELRKCPTGKRLPPLLSLAILPIQKEASLESSRGKD